jgi:hypothetical protein
MQYDKVNKMFYSTFLAKTGDQIAYNMLVNMFINGWIDFINNGNDIQKSINNRFGFKNNTQEPADFNQYLLIFLNSLTTQQTLATKALLIDLQQPKTYDLLSSLLTNGGPR